MARKTDQRVGHTEEEIMEKASEPGTVQVSLPPGMTSEDFTKLLTKSFNKEKKASIKDESINFLDIEKGPDKRLRISRDTYKGKSYNSFREWYADETGTFKPGRGTTFSYDMIDEIIEALNQLKSYLEEHPREGGD